MSKVQGVNICGFVDGDFGIGEATRSTIRSLQTQNIPMAVNNLAMEAGLRRSDRTFTDFSEDNPYPINIIQLNGDTFTHLSRIFKYRYLKDRYNIAYWAWELPEFPSQWTKALYQFDEIWTLSAFCVEAF